MIDEKALTKEMAVWFRELIYVRDNISWRPGLLAPPPALPGQVTWFVGGSPAMASVRAAF